MYINTAIVEKLEMDGTLKSIELKSSQTVGGLVVAFVDEYEEPHSGPFYYRNLKYEDKYKRLMGQAKSRRVGSGFFSKAGNEYVFKTQWIGIPTKRQELSYYALMLPEYTLPTSINLYDPLCENLQYKRSVKRDDLNKCFIIYIECKSSKGKFNFNLECSFVINSNDFFEYQYNDEKTAGSYFYVDVPERYEKVISLKDAAFEKLKGKKITSKKPKIKVLFVDDDPYLAQDYVDELLNIRFAVKVANTAREALRHIKEIQFDIVVLDIRMNFEGAFSSIETAGGWKTGIILAREIKEILPDSLTVALTYFEDEDVQTWFTQDESFRYFSKREYNPHDFAHALKKSYCGISDDEKTESDKAERNNLSIDYLKHSLEKILKNQDKTMKDIDYLINVSGARDQKINENLHDIMQNIYYLESLSHVRMNKNEKWDKFLQHLSSIADSAVFELLKLIGKTVLGIE